LARISKSPNLRDFHKAFAKETERALSENKSLLKKLSRD